MKANNKNNQRGFAHLILVIFALVVLAIVWIALTVAHFRVNKVSTDTIFKNVSNTTKQKYPDMLFERVGWPAENGIGIPLEAKGFNFKISSENMPSLEFMGARDSESPFPGHPECAGVTQEDLMPQVCKDIFNRRITAPEDAQPIIDAEMARGGFKKQAAISYKDSEDEGGFTVTTQVYKLGDQSCVYANRLYVVFSCYDKQSVKDAASRLQTFVHAYQEKNKPIATAYYGPSIIRSKNSGTIKASQTPGYDLAEMIVVHGTVRKVAFFYNKDGGPWKFIAQTDDELGLSCKALSADPDERKAFYGQVCQSSDGAVRLDSAQPALQ